LNTAYDCMDKIAYSYLNPVAADLVGNPTEWEGVSTYNKFIDNRFESEYIRIFPSSLPTIIRKGFNAPKRAQFWGMLKECNKKKHRLILEPYAWKSAFEESRNKSDEQLKEKIIQMVDEGVQKHAKRRKAEGKEVIGMTKLRESNIYRTFRSKEYRRQPICICSCKELRALFYEEYREFKEALKNAWQKWSRGDYTVIFPMGAFRPFCPPTVVKLHPLALA